MDPMGYIYIYIYGGFHKWEYPNTVAGIYNWKSYENGWFGEYPHFRKPMGTTWWCWAPRTAELFVGPQRFSRGGRPGFPSGDPGYSINWSVRELFHVFHSGIKYDFWCFPAKKNNCASSAGARTPSRRQMAKNGFPIFLAFLHHRRFEDSATPSERSWRWRECILGAAQRVTQTPGPQGLWESGSQESYGMYRST